MHHVMSGASLTSAVSRVLLAPHTRRVVTTPAETEARVTRVETLPVKVNIIIKYLQVNV